LRIGCRRGVLLHGGAKLVKRTGVLGVLGRDTFGDGLRAFKLRSGVKEAALLAAMELEIALGTFAVGVEAGREDGAAIRTARTGDGADHARRARAEMIVCAGTALRRFAVV